jgi:hypothetical protein
MELDRDSEHHQTKGAVMTVLEWETRIPGLHPKSICPSWLSAAMAVIPLDAQHWVTHCSKTHKRYHQRDEPNLLDKSEHPTGVGGRPDV